MRGVLRVLSIEVTYRGFSFAILEGPERLIDWGNKTVSGDTSVFLMKLKVVSDRYRPDVLALEEPALSRKGDVVREWLSWAEEHAAERSLTAVALPHGKRSRDTQASEVARLFPELVPHLPSPRRRWESEARGLAKFIAIERGLRAIEHLERLHRAAS